MIIRSFVCSCECNGGCEVTTTAVLVVHVFKWGRQHSGKQVEHWLVLLHWTAAAAAGRKRGVRSRQGRTVWLASANAWRTDNGQPLVLSPLSREFCFLRPPVVSPWPGVHWEWVSEGNLRTTFCYRLLDLLLGNFAITPRHTKRLRDWCQKHVPRPNHKKPWILCNPRIPVSAELSSVKRRSLLQAKDALLCIKI